MQRALRGAVLLLVGLFVLPALAADEKKDAKDEKKEVKEAKDEKKDTKTEPKKDEKTEPKKDEPKKDEKKDEKKPAKAELKKEEKKDNGMVKIGQVVGQISWMAEGSKSLKLRIDVPKLNPSAVQSIAQAELQIQRAAFQQPQQRLQTIANAQRQIAQQKANLYTKTTQEIELALTEDCIVRLKDPPPKFDEKGKLVRPTKKDLDEWKGDPKLPGYKAEMSDVRSNQYVQVTLVRNKNLPRPKVDPKTREIPPEAIAELSPHISMIMIIGEPRQPGQ